MTGVERQQILQLWLANAALDSPVVAWAFYDGADGQADPNDGGAGRVFESGDPPYSTGVEALRAGWFLLAVPMPSTNLDLPPGALTTGFTFERRVTVST